MSKPPITRTRTVLYPRHANNAIGVEPDPISVANPTRNNRVALSIDFSDPERYGAFHRVLRIPLDVDEIDMLILMLKNARPTL